MPSIRDFKKNINAYGNEVRTLSNFTEAVRKTPGQYIGYVGDKGFINMIREVLQNSMDELEKEKSPCTEIWTEYYEDTNTFVCVDNGRGIPFDNIQRIFADEHTSSNYEKEAGEFSAGRHGVGAKVTNALSSHFFVDSFMCKEVSPDGKAHHRRMEFYDGMPWKKGEKELPNKENFQGSRIEFAPCYEIMGELKTACDDVLHLISILLPLMKIGAVINFHGVKKNGKVVNEKLVNNDGIITFLINQTKRPVMNPIRMFAINEDKTMKAEIAFTWASDELDGSEHVISFGNMCPTINESIHVTSFLDAVANYFRVYMNKIYLGKNNKISILNVDIKSGLKAVISAFHIMPMFSGQAKEILSNDDLGPFIRNMVREGLDDWTKKNADDVQRLCKFFKNVATLRLNVNKEKVEVLKKSQVSVFSGLPNKYAKPTGKKNLEFILVEGDSALTPCRTAIDHTCQGIFPIRGKINNAMTCTKKKFFENEECKAIYTILDCGEGRSCDPDKCKFDKIIFLADADVDGLHIRSLLLKMFLVYYKPLVEQGRVYAAVPPLYGIKKKQKSMRTLDDYLTNMQYFTDKQDFVQYVYKEFLKNHKVCDEKNNQYPSKLLTEVLYENYNYVEDMTILSEDYAVDPELMELVYKMIVRNVPFKDIKKTIGKVHKYLDVRLENGILVLDGLANEKVHTVIFTPSMLEDCKNLIGNYVGSKYAELVYILNGKRVSLYGLMKEFYASQPSGLLRYKGLGEMNSVELMVSTINPKYNRTLLKYTTEDMEREINEIRRIDSNFKELLDDVDVANFEI